MPWSIAACAVSRRLQQVNFAVLLTSADEAETDTEPFPASEGLNAQGFRCKDAGLGSLPR